MALSRFRTPCFGPNENAEPQNFLRLRAFLSDTNIFVYLIFIRSEASADISFSCVMSERIYFQICGRNFVRLPDAVFRKIKRVTVPRHFSRADGKYARFAVPRSHPGGGLRIG